MSRRSPRATGGQATRAKVARAALTKVETTPSAAAERPREARAATLQWIVPLVIVGIGIVAYYNSFAGVFLYDDEGRIVNNPQIRELWPPWNAMAHSPRPLADFSLALNYAIGGLSVWGYHAFNLVIHLLAGMTLCAIVRRMLESENLRDRYGSAAPWLAGAAAIIWTVHPLQTESVTYIIQRGEAMMGLFLLLTLYCGIRGAASSHPPRWYVAAIVACALGMASKEVMVVAPLVMLAYDRMFLATSFAQIVRQRAPFYMGLAATWLLIGVAVVNRGTEDPIYMVSAITPWRYLLTEADVIVHYLRLAFWPRPLILDYAWPPLDGISSVLPSAVIALVLLAATVLALYRKMWAGFWGAWFFLILAPTSSVYAIADIAFEHRMYLPLAAVVVLAVVGAYRGLQWMGQRLHAPPVILRSVAGALFGIVTIALVLLTLMRNEDYRGEAVMWADVVAKRPENPRGHYNLGVVLHREGKPDEAIRQFYEAVKLKVDYADAHLNLGAALVAKGELDEALAHTKEAIRLKPAHAPGYKTLGDVLARQGKTDDAITQYTEAIRRNPNYAQAQKALASVHSKLATALHGQGKVKEAIPHFAKVVELDPKDPVARNNLGAALGADGRIDDATREFAEAVRLKPDFTEAQDNLRKSRSMLH